MLVYFLFLELCDICSKIGSIEVEPFTAELVKLSTSVLVHNINSDYANEAFLKFYFEESKSGAGRGAVEDVHLMGNGSAIITFTDSKGI